MKKILIFSLVFFFSFGAAFAQECNVVQDSISLGGGPVGAYSVFSGGPEKGQTFYSDCDLNVVDSIVFDARIFINGTPDDITFSILEGVDPVNVVSRIFETNFTSSDLPEYSPGGLYGELKETTIPVEGVLLSSDTIYSFWIENHSGTDGQNDGLYVLCNHNNPLPGDQLIRHYVYGLGDYSDYSGSDFYFKIYTHECNLVGDFNANGSVDAADLLAFLSEFGCVHDWGNPNECKKDLNGDSQTNAADLLIFLSHFGESCI